MADPAACEEIRSLLAIRSLDVLEDEERAHLDAHLATCATCRRAAASLEEACRVVGAIGGSRRAPPAHLWQGIASALDKPLEDELDAARAVSAIRIALDCSYCRDALTREEAVYCASCLAPHHEECFREHRRCSTYGCDETRTVRPQPSVVESAPRVARPRRRVPLPVAIAGAVALCGASLTVGIRAARTAHEPPPRPASAPMPTPVPKPALAHVAPELGGLVFPDKVVLAYTPSERNFGVTASSVRLERRVGDDSSWERPQVTEEGDRRAMRFTDAAPVASATYRVIEVVHSDDADAPFPTLEAPVECTATWRMPDHPDEVWFQRGVDHLATPHEDAEAVSDFSNAIELNPRNALYWLKRAEARNHSSFEALEDATTSLQLDHRNADAWLARAVCRHNLGVKGAFADADEAVKLAPKEPAAWRWRAYLREHDDGSEAAKKLAVADLRHYLELVPSDAPEWERLIGLVRDNVNATAALADADRAVAACPSAAELVFLRSTLRDPVRDADRALADVGQAIELKPGEARYWARRASILVAIERWEEAERAATRAVELGYRGSVVLEPRAEARLHLGDWSGAILDADGLLRDNSYEFASRAYRIRGLAQAARENVEEARTDLEFSLKAMKEDDPARPEVQAKLDELRKAR